MDHDGSVSHLEAANSWSLNGLIYKYPSVEAADSSIYKSNVGEEKAEWFSAGSFAEVEQGSVTGASSVELFSSDYSVGL
jgi:hypothetical protein